VLSKVLFRIDHCCFGNSTSTLHDIQGCHLYIAFAIKLCTSLCVCSTHFKLRGVILNIICIKHTRRNCSRGCIMSILSSPLLLLSLYSYLDCIHMRNWGSITCISSALHTCCNILCWNFSGCFQLHGQCSVYQFIK
jgi:hypothetical protein